jgi:hypothetical protein
LPARGALGEDRSMWSDRDDTIIRGDLTAALAYATPAGGCVVATVAPIGLADREAGTVGFTTSLGFGRKLERLRRDPRAALSYHAREHGLAPAADEGCVLVQGTASFREELPSPEELDAIGERATPFMGEPARGAFWDRWLQAYYRDRIVVTVAVERVLRVPGDTVPPPAPPQSAPKGGTAPRVDVTKAARRARALPHRLLAWRGEDGFPVIAPVDVGATTARGFEVRSAAGLPDGGRRAGFLAHSYRRKLVGLESRQHTGWLEDGVYAPHTASGFVAPPNKTLLLLANGFMARRGLRRALRERAARPA